MNVTVYTDGSFCRRSGAAGWAFLVRHPRLEGVVEQSGSFYAKDNNQTEWRALEYACHQLLEAGVTDAMVTLYTDSDHCLRRFDQSQLMGAGAASVTVTHSPAHKGARSMLALYNGHVDRLAKAAMRALRDGLSGPSTDHNSEQG